MEIDFEKIFKDLKGCFIDYDTLSKKYRPSEIRLLIVGNAPPRWRYFYKEDVKEFDGLFLAVTKSMNPELTEMYKRSRTPEIKKMLLDEFKNIGGYLMDIYPQPEEDCKLTGELSYWIDDFKKRIKDIPLSPSAKIVLCHKNSWQLQTFFGYKGYSVEKLNCPVQRNQSTDNSEYQGTFVRKVSRIFLTLKDGKAADENF